VVGVSAGSLPAHFLVSSLKDKPRLVDFSGLATLDQVEALDDSGENKLKGMASNSLFIFGEYDYSLRNPKREALLERFKRNGSSVVRVSGEGHNLRGREAMERNFRSFNSFLFTSK